MEDDSMEDEPTQQNNKGSASSGGSLVHKFCLSVLSWLGVYLLGYFNLSVGWLATPILLGLLNDHWKKEEKQKLSAAAESALTDEQSVIESRIRVEDLPSWVFFPDKDRAEWFNRILEQLWPKVNQYVRKLLFQTVEPTVKAALDGYKMKGFKFDRDRVYMGQIAPRITGIKVYDSKVVSRNEIIMDMDIAWASDMEIVFALRPITGTLSDLSLRGTIRVVFKPLISDMPLIGGIQVYFLTRPEIDFELGGVGGIPGLKSILVKNAHEQVSNLIVLPNKITIPLVSSLSKKILKCPDTAGVLRVKLHGAKDLMAKDFSLTGKGKSDPYGLLTVGATLHNVPIRKSTLNPTWELEYDFPIEVVLGQQLILELFDDDKGSDDEFLGRAIVQTSVVAERGFIEKSWIDLEGCKSGKVELTLSWLPITRDPSLVKDSANSSKPGDESAKCLVHVYIDSVANLKCGKGSYKPNPVVQLLNAQNQQRKTWPKYKCNDAEIEQGFVLLVTNPELDKIRVRVLDSAKGDEEIAHTNIDIWTLVNEPNMEYNNQPWILQGNSPEATIVMSVQLCGLLPPGDEEALTDTAGQGNNQEDVNQELTVSHNLYDENVRKGKIKVIVHKAVNLEAKDVGGTSDPYTKIKYGKQKFKTDTVKKSLDPQWEHEVLISTNTDGDKQIHFEVFDKDKIGKDESLGFTTLDVRTVSKQGKMVDVWESLQGCKTGRILLSLEFYPEDQPPAEDAATDVAGKNEDPVEGQDKMAVDNQLTLENKADNATKEEANQVTSQNSQQEPNIPSTSESDKKEIGSESLSEKEENTNSVITTGKEKDENIPTISENKTKERQPEAVIKTIDNKEIKDAVAENKESGIENIAEVAPGTLTILFVRAEDLESKDFNGKSDPYVTISYDGKTLKSKIHKKTLTPEFNYNTKWNISPDGPTDIFIQLFDHDGIGKDESLGTITLDLHNVLNKLNKLNDTWFNLENAKSGKVLIKFAFERKEPENRLEEDSMVPLTPYGKIRMTIRYDENKSELKVFVLSASDLPGGDLPDPPDPYVSLCLVPGGSKIKKTKVVVDSCNPSFDQEFDFNVKLSKLLGQSLQVTVMDKKGVFTKSSIMGRKEIILDNPCLCQGITDWFPLEDVIDDSK